MTVTRSRLPKITEGISGQGGIIGTSWYRFLARIERLVIGGTTTAGTGLSETASGALTIADDGVTNDMLRESVALSVIGNPYNDVRNPQDVAAAANGRVLQRNNDVLEFGLVRLASFTVATVPSAVSYGAGTLIFVSNESGGAQPAASDGTNWRRFTDRAIIS